MNRSVGHTGAVVGSRLGICVGAVDGLAVGAPVHPDPLPLLLALLERELLLLPPPHSVVEALEGLSVGVIVGGMLGLRVGVSVGPAASSVNGRT